jgi:hypothetical protein
MKAYLARLTTFDWIKVVAYAIATLTFLEGSDVLTAFGVSAADAATWTHRFSVIVGGLTLISNSFKNTSAPSGSAPVFTTAPTAPTPETLITSSLKG